MRVQRLEAARSARRGAGDARSLVVARGGPGDPAVLSIVGDLDLASAPRLVSEAADVLRGSIVTLLLDLEQVPLIDSAGLAALLNVLRRAHARGARVVLAGVRPEVRRVFGKLRLEREFTFAPDVVAARRLAR